MSSMIGALNETHLFSYKWINFLFVCYILIVCSCTNKTTKETPGERLRQEYQYDELPDSEKANIKFNEFEFDFGRFDKNIPQKFRFTFYNIGKSPLILHDVHSYCGCVQTHFIKTPILPGKKGYIDVIFNGKEYEKGVFNKDIVVNSNAVNKYITLTVKGEKL